jgi:cell division septation protein DedD
MTMDPQNEMRPTARPTGHVKRPPSSLAGLKPFLLAGLLVVIGLLVGLNFLLGGSGESSPPTEPVAGSMTIGPPPGGALSEGRPSDQETPPTSTTGASPTSSPGSTTSGQTPVTPSEFTFYETLKKAPHDPAATVGLTTPKALAKPAPPKSAAKSGQSKPAAAPAKLSTAHAKPAPSKNRVIDTMTADNSTFHYTVQVAAFRQQSMAEEMIKALNKKGHDAYLATGASPDGDGVTYRVRVGRFTTREEADHAAKLLAAKEKLHPFIATVEPELSKRS